MTSSLVDAIASPGVVLHACLDGLARTDPGQLDGPAQAAFLADVVRAESRLASIRLRLLAAAERSRTAQRAGAASTGQWAAGIARSDQAETQRQVSLATALNGLDTTRETLARGEVSVAHAAVIVRADRDLPTDLARPERARIEEALVEKARVLSPEALRRAARRALETVEADRAAVDAHENEVVRSEEESARARTRLSLHDNEDGTVTGHFTLPSLHGQLLRKILEAITAPRRGRLGASTSQVGTTRRTDWDQARGLAFCELVEHLPTDHLHPRTAATVLVTIGEDALRDALRVAQLDTGATLSAGEARRLACGAGLLPVVLGGASVPLDLGRSARLFSESQRVALAVRHRTCVADGCERPFAWCELHHEDPWSSGGRTDLAKADPLCHFHHQRIHDPGFRISRGADGGIRFHART